MIFGPCYACQGEGAIGSGTSWVDGGYTHWDFCLTCNGTGEIELESEPLDGDEEEFFGLHINTPCEGRA